MYVLFFVSSANNECSRLQGLFVFFKKDHVYIFETNPENNGAITSWSECQRHQANKFVMPLTFYTISEMAAALGFFVAFLFLITMPTSSVQLLNQAFFVTFLAITL